MFFQVLSKVSVLFIILFIGGLARYRNILNKESTRALAQVVLLVTLPFLYFYSLSTELTFELLRTIWILPVFSVTFIAIAYAISTLLSRRLPLDSSQKATFIYLSTFTNCGFLAIPIAHALYGAEGVIRVIFFNVGFNILYWTLGVWTLRRTKTDSLSTHRGIAPLFRNLINSGTIGLLCGIVAGLMAVRIPSFVLDSTNLLGSATIPLALLVVGSIMSKGEVGKVKTYKQALAMVIFCRLILMPVIALLITGFLTGLTPLVRAIIVLQAAMPSASTTPIFTMRFGGDSQLASAGVFATHICSIITIPVFISLL